MTVVRRGRGVLASAAVGALAVDIATKVAASAWLADGPVRLGPLLTLRLVHNRGIAFGVAAAAPAAVILAASGAISVVLVVMAWRGGLGAQLPAGLIVGGALANVVDRVTGGSVVDFLDIGRWPTFNLADVFLVSGIGMLALLPQPAPAPARPGTLRRRSGG